MQEIRVPGQCTLGEDGGDCERWVFLLCPKVACKLVCDSSKILLNLRVALFQRNVCRLKDP